MSLRVLAGGQPESLPRQPLRKPFDPKVLSFCRALSEALLHHLEAREYPELVALGFWLRDSHLRQLQKSFGDDAENRVRRPLGVVMHFTPANVDTMFVYSWVCSLLMGNANMVRLSSEESTVKRLLLETLKNLFESPDYPALAASNVFVSYPHDDDVASELSLLADARVIWGGDDAVQAIRRLPCKPRCRDVPFADRYSAALINGDEVAPDSLEVLSDRLWRDIHPYQQMACSSPRVIFWQGSDEHLKDFWYALNARARGETTEIIQRTEHLVLSQTLQALGNSTAATLAGPVSLVPVDHFHADLMERHPGQGVCYLVKVKGRDVLEKLDERCQSLVYWGISVDELGDWMAVDPGGPLDRIVPVGQALNFTPAWDGFELFGMLSRTTIIQ